MEQKSKIIILGLVIFLVASLFLFVQASSVKQQLERERDELKTENTSLTAKMDKLTSALRAYESKIGSLNSELERVMQDKADLEKKYELADQARQELIEKLKARREEAPVVREEPRPTYTPQNNDDYWADVLKAKADLEAQLSRLKDLQISNEQLQRGKANFDLELNSLKREKDDLVRQLEYNKRLLDGMAQELVREKNDKSKIEDTYKTIRSENAVLTRQISSLNTRKVDLEKGLQELKTEKAALERRVSEMESMLNDKLGQIDNLKDKIDVIKSGVPVEEKSEPVQLPQIIVKPKPSAKGRSEDSGGALVGRIMAVNKENNFVIIDLGSEAGVKARDNFRVYRGEKPIANIEVIQVRQGISACDIKNQGAAIKIGDTVR
jgi:DNA repair exonuclease SbcCD ATPase subunit